MTGVQAHIWPAVTSGQRYSTHGSQRLCRVGVCIHIHTTQRRQSKHFGSNVIETIHVRNSTSWWSTTIQEDNKLQAVIKPIVKTTTTATTVYIWFICFKMLSLVKHQNKQTNVYRFSVLLFHFISLFFNKEHCEIWW